MMTYLSPSFSHWHTYLQSKHLGWFIEVEKNHFCLHRVTMTIVLCRVDVQLQKGFYSIQHPFRNSFFFSACKLQQTLFGIFIVNFLYFSFLSLCLCVWVWIKINYVA
jgi:hypothetical protein